MSTSVPINLLDIVDALRDLDDAARDAKLRELNLSPRQRSQVDRLLRALPKAEAFLETPPTLVRDAWSSASSTPGSQPTLGCGGAAFGEYRLIQHLASGAFGEVWVAAHRSLDAPSAVPSCLKLLYPDRSDLEDVLREARTMASIRHENVVSVHRADRADLAGQSIAYIEMELVGEVASGGAFEPAKSLALAGAADRKPQFSPSQAMAIVADVARGVHAAHLRGILHRDLKPANILIALPSLRVKVTDFGIASHSISPGTTSSQRGLGTPAYMAPEQADGEATQASDVYALGAVLHFLLSGEAPYGKSEGSARAEWREILDQLKRGEAPRRLPLESRRISKPLAAIVAKAMHRDPASRYASAAAMADDLDACRAGRPTLAENPGPLRRMFMWCRRNPAVAILLLTILIGAIVGPISYVTSLRQEQARTESQRQAAIAAQETAQAQERTAIEQRQIAQRQLAEGLVLQADAQALAGRWLEARQTYRNAAAALIAQGLPTFPADSGLWAADRASVPPLLEWRDVKYPPMGLAASPDGKLIASATGDGVLRVWDPMTSRLIRELRGHIKSVHGVAFSPDGKTLATAGADGTVRLWDPAADKPPTSFDLKAGDLRAIVYSRDGQFLAVGGYGKKVVVLNAQTGEVSTTISLKSSVESLCFFPGGGRLAIGAGEVLVYDLEAKKQIKKLSGFDAAIALSTDGTRLAMRNEDTKISILDTSDWHTVMTLEGHERHFISAAVFAGRSSDRLITAGWDRKVRVWDLKTQKQAQQIPAHEGWVLSLAVLPDGHRIVTGGYDRVAPMRLWDVDDRPAELSGEVRDISADGRCLLLQGKDELLHLYDLAANRDLAVLPQPKNTSFNTYFRDGVSRVIAHDGGGFGLREWDTAARNVTREKRERGWIGISPDGKFTLIYSQDLAALLDSQSGKEIWKTRPGDYLEYVKFSGDGRTFVTWNEGNPFLLVWETATGKWKKLPQGESYYLRDAALTHDGRLVLLSRGTDQIELRDTATLSLVRTFSTHGTPVAYVALDPNARWAAGIGESGAAWLWDLSTAREIRTINVGFRSTWLRTTADGSKLLVFGDFPTLCDFSRPIEERQIQEQMEAAQMVLKNKPEDPAALATLGRWHAFRHADDWAVVLLEKARAAGGKVASLDLARCYWRLDKWPEANREFKAALQQKEAPADYLNLCINATGGK